MIYLFIFYLSRGWLHLTCVLHSAPSEFILVIVMPSICPVIFQTTTLNSSHSHVFSPEFISLFCALQRSRALWGQKTMLKWNKYLFGLILGHERSSLAFWLSAGSTQEKCECSSFDRRVGVSGGGGHVNDSRSKKQGQHKADGEMGIHDKWNQYLEEKKGNKIWLATFSSFESVKQSDDELQVHTAHLRLRSTPTFFYAHPRQ